MKEQRITVLVLAYSVNPYKGSEDGLGWNYVKQIAKYQSAVVLTRENNIPDIEKYLSEHPGELDHIQFVGYDLPYYMRFWKRKQFGSQIYFYLWRMLAPNFIKKQKIAFDVSHTLTFFTSWIPDFLWKLGKPTVWGPTAHHPQIPQMYLRDTGGMIGKLKNRVLWFIKQQVWKYDLNLKKAVENVDRIIVPHQEVVDKLNIPKGKHVHMFTAGASARSLTVDRTNHKFNVLSIGRLVSLKGFDVTIKAFHEFVSRLEDTERGEVQLNIIGSGPLEGFIKQYIGEHNLSDVINLTTWMPQEKLSQEYVNGDVFLFPSHEGAGMVVPEAMAYSMPVLCFDNIGPGEFINESSGIAYPYSTIEGSVKVFADGLMEMFKNSEKRKELGEGALQRFNERFLWDVKAEPLRDIYSEILKTA